MHNKLLTIICLFCTVLAHAQKKDGIKAPVAAPPVPKIDYTQIGAPMPNLLLVTLDTMEKQVKKNTNWWNRLWHKDVTIEKTNQFTNKDFDNNANLFVMMFNPNCSHCIEETEVIKHNIGLFQKSKLVLVANSRMKEYLPDFVKQRETKKYPQMTVGLDNANFVNDAFLYRSLPQINIYNPERKLIKIYNGDVAIDSLKPYIQ